MYNGRNKTFFFFGYQKLIEKKTQAYTSQTPSPDMLRGDFTFAWREDGHVLYAFRHGEVPCTVYRLDLATRRKEVWKVLSPPDLTGVPHIGRVRITPDAGSYAYGHIRHLSDMYLAQGVR